ncbi:uncharacterized protein CDAR_300611 [Caerostris darwini]|uniref:Uncharacterized protein n=1 Tax=Caerostris darwini TaxID=1538125 RepID=A0AAV4RV30_9ARAC|nr:uncharacterized protein CDAR_300611 [Caerostris darwini]
MVVADLKRRDQILYASRSMRLRQLHQITRFNFSGVPIQSKISPTPRWPSRPLPHTYIPKRFLRLWSQKQDELLMEIPSGDGPIDHWDSPVLPGKTSEKHHTKSDKYATRSPLPEDISPSQSDPFPSIIDTVIESSQVFSDEFVSRSSVPFNGPSSLLNTLIFRPSLPDQSSSIVITPTLKSSAIAQTTLYGLSASWTEMDELTSSFKMSSRRALSYSPSEIFAIITAISATYIYQEDSNLLPINPSSVYELPFGSMTSGLSVHPTERLPDVDNATSTFIEKPSVHLQSFDVPYFDISSTNQIFTESRFSVSNIQSSLSTILFSLGISESLTENNSPDSTTHGTIVDYLLISPESSSQFTTPLSLSSLKGHSTNLIGSSHLTWNSFSTSVTIHTSSLSSETYYFNNNTIDVSFGESQLIHPSTHLMPLFTPQQTFFLSTVETTVTIIDNKDTPFTYILPTLTVTGTSFNGIFESFTNYPEDFILIQSRSELDFSTFKHLSSSFDTFSTVQSIQEMKSDLPHISMENFISTRSFISENQSDFIQPKEETLFLTETYSDFSTNGPIYVKTYEHHITANTMFLSPLFSETLFIPTLSSFSDTDSELQSIQLESLQTGMETTTKYFTTQLKSSIHNVSEHSASPTLPNDFYNSVLEDNETQAISSETLSSIASSFNVEEQVDDSLFRKSTNYLSTEISNETRKSDGDLSSSFLLENKTKELQFQSVKSKDKSFTIPQDSNNFLDPFTHHVTVRSLRGSSNFDILTHDILDEATTGKFNAKSSSIHTLEEPFGTSYTTKYFPSLYTTQIHPSRVLTSVLSTQFETLLSDEISHSLRDKNIPTESMFTETSSIEELTTHPNLEKVTGIYFSESSITPLITLDSENESDIAAVLTDLRSTSTDEWPILPEESSHFMQSYSTLTDILVTTYKEPDISEIFIKPLKSTQAFTNTDISLPEYTEVTESLHLPDLISQISPTEIFLTNTLVSFSYEATPHFPVPFSKQHSNGFSELDNHFLESSNASSKALDDVSSFKSAINQNKSMEIDIKSKISETIFHSRDYFESILNTFASDFLITPSPSMLSDSEAGPLQDTSSLQEEPRRSYFEFHESTRILDFETKLLRSGLLESSEYVHSAIHDSFETSDHLSSDFKVSSTPTLSVDQSSLLFPSNNLFTSLIQEESSFSTENGIFNSQILQGHSKVKSEITPTLNFPKEIVTSPLLSIVSSDIQKSKSMSTTFGIDDFSVISFGIKSSFPEIDVFDLSTYFRDLSLSTEESSLGWSSPLSSTIIKQPRSLDSFPAESLTESSLSLQPLVTYATKELESTTRGAKSIKSEHWEINSSLMTPILLSSISLFSETQKSEHISSSQSLIQPSSSEYPPLQLESTSTELPSTTLSSHNFSIITKLTTPSAKEPQSLESDFPKPRQTHSFIFPKQTSTTSISSKFKDPISIETDRPRPIIPHSLQTPVLSSFSTVISVRPQSSIKEPMSIETDQPGIRLTRTYSTPILPHTDYLSPVKTLPIDSKNIDSSHFQTKTSSSVLKSSSSFVVSSKLHPTSTQKITKDPLSIESDFPKPKTSPRISLQTSVWSAKPQFEETSSHLYHFQSSFSPIKPTTDKPITKTYMSSTWLGDVSTTPVDSDVILVSVLPISSFLNVNQTKNGSDHTEESHSTLGEQAIPTRNTYLFKDNHYWVLTVLEAPAKGQLPENFSHIMEGRLANAYSEAFRSWSSKKEDAKSNEDIVVVKILSLTDDILLRQLKIVYVVERAGSLVPSSIAAEYLSSLRFEQLREFLGYHAIEKAKPYRPPSDDVSRPVGSPLPVLAIVGGVLLGLLVVFCCFCVYCRCCRPKPPPSSPGSSASGSLQRSLSKYGQHNRKHLFREMTHQLTSEMAAQIKHGSTAPDTYLAEKSGHRSLPTLPRESNEKKPEASMKILKILENKEASTSPMPGKHSKKTNAAVQQSSDSSSAEKKKPPKPKKRRKVKDSVDQASKNVITDSVDSTRDIQPESPPPTPPPKRDVSIPSADKRQSPDSGTSSRHHSQPSSSSEKGTEEPESEGSNTELLPPIQDLIERSKSESEAAAAETQVHLSRVRQRITELLDDAFAMAGGRRLYGSLRSKKIEPTTEVFPRFGSFRSQSAAGGEFALSRHPGGISIERRPISEGGQRILGVLTDEGQLITHPPPKLVWEQDEGYPVQAINRHFGNEMVEARNRNINLFPFNPQRIHQLPALPSSSSLPFLDTLPESRQDTAMISPISILREAASELYLPHSARMNPAIDGQYDELDVVSALRNGEPVEALIQAIKDELQRFAGSLPGTNDGESNA